MCTEDLVDYLKNWMPPDSGLPFDRPSRAGVAGTLRDWVSDDPQTASKSLESFLTTELNPAYITAMLDSFSGALKTDKEFDVYAVARAIQWVAEHTDAITETKGDGEIWEATWNWAHMSAARFMTNLFLHEKRLDITKASELFPVVRALCFLPRPTIEDEVKYKKKAESHVSYALNTPRPVGVEAMIRYGRWIKLATPEAEFTPASLAPVLEVLAQKLNAAEEPSAGVREMLAMQFRTLAWLDVDWLKLVIPKLFPRTEGASKEEKILDRFAWNAYLRYAGTVHALVSAMRKRYMLAVRALQEGNDSVPDIERTLASHLMQFYAHGVIELDDPLLVHFFGSASVKLRTQAVGDIGWRLGQEATPLSPEIQSRLMRLWESRMALLSAGSKKDAAELATFGWWLASRKFPDEWAVKQAIPILEYIRSLSPDFAVVEAFSNLSTKYPYEAVRVVHVLFEEDQNGWSIHGWNQYLDDILKRALNDGELARQEAERSC